MAMLLPTATASNLSEEIEVSKGSRPNAAPKNLYRIFHMNIQCEYDDKFLKGIEERKRLRRKSIARTMGANLPEGREKNGNDDST